tara:strand:+ start:393869 stop:394873 length:1005 start_codon:yes stop_codon:yes gene_type:complete
MGQVFSEPGKFDIYVGDPREVLPESFEKQSVHCSITSPPYWKQRTYGHDGEIGNEPTLESYLDNVCGVFDAVRPVLRNDGTLFVNIGDKVDDGQCLNIPFMFAEEMKRRGWFQRQWMPWLKRNGIPKGGPSKPNDNLEVILMFSKTKGNYYYDQLSAKEQAGLTTRMFRNGDSITLDPEPDYWVFDVLTRKNFSPHFSTFPPLLAEIMVRAGTSDEGVHPTTGEPAVRKVEKRRYATRSGTKSKEDKSGMAFRDKGRHITEFSTLGWEFSQPIKVDEMSKPIVLDPFSGLATTGVACMDHRRFYKGIELVEEFAQEGRDRLLTHNPPDVFDDVQ